MPVSPDFAKTSMLVSVNIRSFAAKKEDKKVSRKVAADNGTSKDSGKYQKQLVPKALLDPITKAIGSIRTFHYENSMPWTDEGIRILPSANYEAYKTGFESLRDEFESAVHDFCNAWPEIVAKAQAELKGLYNPADYPVDIRSKFGLSLRFMPVAGADDFRVNISDLERDILKAQIGSTVDAAVNEATADLYRRLREATVAMAERLRAYQVDPATGKTSGVFRDSLVENLRELVGLIPRLNFQNDQELEACRKLIEADLCSADADTLRESDATRERVADSADAIAKRLSEFMA